MSSSLSSIHVMIMIMIRLTNWFQKVETMWRWAARNRSTSLSWLWGCINEIVVVITISSLIVIIMKKYIIFIYSNSFSFWRLGTFSTILLRHQERHLLHCHHCKDLFLLVEIGDVLGNVELGNRCLMHVLFQSLIKNIMIIIFKMVNCDLDDLDALDDQFHDDQL